MEDLVRDIDRHVGRRIREWRRQLGMSQSNLAHPLGLSSQQFVKFEYGTNRVKVGRLFILTLLLDTDMKHFFTGAATSTIKRRISAARSFSPNPNLVRRTAKPPTSDA